MSAQKCQDLLSSLMEYACTPEFSYEMEIARELFALSTGKVNDDDPFYDMRMAAFQEYFIFEYRLSEVFPGSTVFEYFLLKAQERLGLAELHSYEQLRSFRHSLFLVEKYRRDRIQVRDLIARTTDDVDPLPDFSFAGFETGQVFDGRLVSLDGAHYFTGAFIFHPKEVRGIIEKYLKNYLSEQKKGRPKELTTWEAEIARRNSVLAAVKESRKVVEQSERKRAIDILNMSKKLVPFLQDLPSQNLVMALGVEHEVSPFVPESAFHDSLSLIHRLAYCEIRSHRYKHIDPLKVYAMEREESFKSPQAVGIPVLQARQTRVKS